MVLENKKLNRIRMKVAVNDLKIHPKALAIYLHNNIEGLVNAIEMIGGLLFNPCVTKNMLVLAGWRRVLAAKLLGWEHIFVEVMEDLPEEDEELFIIESNYTREKTALEKYHEIKVLEIELPKRQGQVGAGEDGKPYNQRAEIAKKMDIAESEVRDLKVVGESENGEELLGSIDGKTITLTALARKVASMKGKVDYSGYVPVELIDMEPLPCPLCNTHLTKRIEITNRELFFIE